MVNVVICLFVGILLFCCTLIYTYCGTISKKQKSGKVWLLLLVTSLYLIAHPMLGSIFVTRNDTVIAKFENYTVYENEDGVAYVLDIHHLKFWDMYDKKELTEEYAKTLKQTYNDYKKYNIKQKEMLEKMENFYEVQK